MISIEQLQHKIGYRFSEERLLRLALTHRSYSADNNERLEFLGDAILNFLIAEELFHRFDDAREGQLSRLRALMVRRQTLSSIAREFELGDHLSMGSGELKSGGFDRDSILADALEAIIGAIYLDADLDTLRSRLLDWFEGRLDALSLERSLKDAKSRLQEYLQARSAQLPEYVVVSLEGKSHEQQFVVECRVELLERPAIGRGASRRRAEQAAAAMALRELGVAHEGEAHG